MGVRFPHARPFLKGESKMKVKLKPSATPRNPFVKLAMFKKAGSHKKSNKALRRQQNMRDRSSMVEQDAFNVKVQSSSLCGLTI